MPRVIEKKLKSLCQICVECVSDNMDELCKIWTSKQPNVVGPEINNNPFELLPIVKLEEIVKILSTKGRIKKHVLQFLIVPQLRQLDLNWIEDEDESSGLLNQASLKCLHLKKLRLCRHHISEDFIAYLPTFVKLHILDVSFSAIDDHGLQIIGASCKELKELNISHCKGVTDVGIQGLCVPSDHLGGINDRQGLCQSIFKLSTSGTKITKQGIQLALSNLPSLKVWDEVSVQLLYNIHYMDFFTKNFEDIPKYSLINIRVSDVYHDPFNTPYICESLNLIVSICPFVMQVKIMTVEGLQDSDLQSLLFLERLAELQISGSNENECSITFNDGIAPVLKGIGSSLKTLSLSHLVGINIHVIIEHCSSLRSLTLELNHGYVGGTSWTEKDEKRIKLEPRVLGQLEELRLSSVSTNVPIPSENLVSLLSTPSLKNISIRDCITLTDKVFEKAAKLHNFRNLDYLQLISCHYVTGTVFELLMNDDNVLKKMVLLNCRRLTQCSVDFWRDVVNANNWLLSIDYENFESALELDSSAHSNSENENVDYEDYFD